MSVNQIIISGTISAKKGIEVKQSDNGAKYLFLSVKATKPGTEKSQFFRVACWGAVAEKAAKDLSDGASVLVSGKITNDARKDADDNWIDNWTVHAADVQLLGGASPAKQSAPPPDDDFEF